MKKNEEYVGIVNNIGANGEGVILNGDTVVFLPYAITGEKVRYKILKTVKNCAYAKLLEVCTPSEKRVRPKCSAFIKCGGCQIQHIDYSSQLKIKEDAIHQCFKKIAGLDITVDKTVECKNEYHYRNKLSLPVGQDENGFKIGFYAENSHRVVAIEDCPINPAWTKDVISAFSEYMKEFNLSGYNEITHKGNIREITVREVSDALIITAVINGDNLIGEQRLIEIIKSKIDKEFSLFYNVNKKDTNVIYGEKFTLLYGKPFYYAEQFGIKYKIGVQSFMQVNDYISLKLYQAVKDNALTDDETTVIDAYSGAGLMTALTSKDAKNGVGIEIVKEAVDCADELMKINGLDDKVVNYCGKCEDILPKIIPTIKNKTCLILDPPRKGCDEKVIRAITESNIEKIIYVSCMPSTLARDVGLLTGNLIFTKEGIKKSEKPSFNYKIRSITPFDMFPQTKHVETLCVLTKYDR
ncbi:MAG: 23S rRNA (uracil(1939)-C(5))-methyltransferase RlmD [Clostridia bacterium]|nr:23S rRNA (uracil(1939)-C(5))-methyltransferase RlmD [Clostridia bacterium]